MQSLCIFLAGDDRNRSHDPSSGCQRPGAATTRRPGPEVGGGSARCPELPRVAQLGSHLRAPGGSRPLRKPHLQPGHPRPASRPGPRPPATRSPKPGLASSTRPPARSPRPGPHSRSTSCSLARSSSSLPLRLSASLFSDASVSFSCSPSVAIFAPGRGGEGSGERGCG